MNAANQALWNRLSILGRSGLLGLAGQNRLPQPAQQRELAKLGLIDRASGSLRPDGRDLAIARGSKVVCMVAAA